MDVMFGPVHQMAADSTRFIMAEEEKTASVWRTYRMEYLVQNSVLNVMSHSPKGKDGWSNIASWQGWHFVHNMVRVKDAN